MVNGFTSGFAGGLAGGATVTIFIRAVDQFSKPLTKADKSIKRLRATGLALGVGLALAVKQTIEFESAFTGVRKTVELTEAGFEDLQKRFEELSTSIPISFVELSKIGELAGQLGVKGVDNLEKFTRTIADISRTTNLTAEAAATDFARISNIMQEPIDNVDRLGSVTVQLGNNLATTEQEITNFALRIAAAGKISGFATSDILAIGAAFSSVGVQAERGGTAVNKVLINMTEAIAEGGEKLELFSRTAGLTTLEFKELFEKDAAGAFQLFVEGLGTAGDEAFGILENLGLADQRLIQSFLALANAGDLLGDALRLANNEFEANTALTEEAEKRYQTLESQITLVVNELKLLGKEFGEQIAPILKDTILPVLSSVIDGFSGLNDKNKELIVSLGGIVTLGAGLSFVSKSIAKRFIIWATTIVVVNNLLSRLGSNIVGVFVGAIGLAATAIIGIVNTVAEAFDFMVNGAINAINLLINALNVIPGVNISQLQAGFTIGRANFPEIDFGPKGIGEGFNAVFKEGLVGEEGFGSIEGGRQIFNIAIENIFGTDPEDISRALSDELTNQGITL